MQRFVQFETVICKAPLGMRFLDLVSGTNVTDGLVVKAWQVGTSGPQQVALRSPLSGIYGFRNLPGLHRFETGEQPASDWCSSPPDVGEPTADELADISILRGLLSADESPPVGTNFIVYIEDRMQRFLPQVLLMCLPKERLVEVPLFSSPARLAPAGLGVVRGQLAIHQKSGPASWALVIATLDSHSYVAVADARGMFTIFVPYASALPPLEGSPPHGGGSIDQLTWPVVVQVFYQPSEQQFVPNLVPPDTLSIMQQARANVYDQMGTPVAELTRAIRFGGDLVVATLGQSELLVDPVP
jgi:hypothetical protein